jgi:hypothetical protein
VFRMLTHPSDHDLGPSGRVTPMGLESCRWSGLIWPCSNICSNTAARPPDPNPVVGWGKHPTTGRRRLPHGGDVEFRDAVRRPSDVPSP